MYTQANECRAEPPLWLQSKALVSSASSGQPEPAEGTGGVQVLGSTNTVYRIMGTSGIRTDNSETFLGFLRVSGTLGAGADLQDFVGCVRWSGLA